MQQTEATAAPRSWDRWSLHDVEGFRIDRIQATAQLGCFNSTLAALVRATLCASFSRHRFVKIYPDSRRRRIPGLQLAAVVPSPIFSACNAIPTHQHPGTIAKIADSLESAATTISCAANNSFSSATTSATRASHASQEAITLFLRGTDSICSKPFVGTSCSLQETATRWG